MAKFERHIFVCTNTRPAASSDAAPRPSCNPDGASPLVPLLKVASDAAGLRGRIRINKAGCLDQCEHGPTVVVYPDAVWYGHVQPADVEEIVSEHLVHGRPVERLVLAGACINTASCAHKPAKP